MLSHKDFSFSPVFIVLWNNRAKTPAERWKHKSEKQIESGEGLEENFPALKRQFTIPTMISHCWRVLSFLLLFFHHRWVAQQTRVKKFFRFPPFDVRFDVEWWMRSRLTLFFVWRHLVFEQRSPNVGLFFFFFGAWGAFNPIVVDKLIRLFPFVEWASNPRPLPNGTSTLM
jgi:hypothetical protein